MNGRLVGARIWLSGSVPDNASDGEGQRIREFVQTFAEAVFREGGTIVHGSHPSLIESLLSAAERYKQASPNRSVKAPLGLFVSRYFSKSPKENGIDLERWQDLCGDGVEQTPEALWNTKNQKPSEADLRSKSLEIMRQSMVARCNAIVALGGKWWQVNRSMAGVVQEIQLAKDSYVPLFLIGGVGGGAVKALLKDRELARDCANGLAKDENETLAAEKNPAIAAQKVVDQLMKLPLRKISLQKKRPFRILCLDGGGIRGAYTAAVLHYLEKEFGLHRQGGLRLADHFDLIAGTSTGGILAVGLGLGMSAEEMQLFYEKNGGTIFGTGAGFDAWWHSFRHWFTSKFSQSALQTQLAHAYSKSSIATAQGATRPTWIDQSICRLLIAAYNTEIDRPHLFRTPHGRFKNSDRGNDAVSIALASAAAPTYFDPVNTKNVVTSFAAIDGGVWANSPVSIAIAEAIGELDISLDQIRVLSIGTTYTNELMGKPMQLDGKPMGAIVRMILPRPFGSICGFIVERLWRPLQINGLAGWVANIASLLMKTQSQTSDIIARHLLGDRYVRIDSSTQYGELDDISRTNHFVNLGQEAAKEATTIAKVQALFFNDGPASPWRE